MEITTESSGDTTDGGPCLCSLESEGYVIVRETDLPIESDTNFYSGVSFCSPPRIHPKACNIFTRFVQSISPVPRNPCCKLKDWKSYPSEEDVEHSSIAGGMLDILTDKIYENRQCVKDSIPVGQLKLLYYKYEKPASGDTTYQHFYYFYINAGSDSKQLFLYMKAAIEVTNHIDLLRLKSIGKVCPSE